MVTNSGTTRFSKETSTGPELIYYALGGGYGHATRSLVLARASGLRFRLLLPERLRGWTGEEATFVPVACQTQPQALAEWVAAQCGQARLVIVDTFPRGVLGELPRFECPAFLIARWMKPAYAHRPEVVRALDRFTQVLACERTPWPVRRYLGPVVRPPALAAEPCECLLLSSGPAELQAEQRAVLSRERVEYVCERDPDRVLSLLAGARLVVAAGGYNSYAEIVQAGIPAIFWPQPRLYDQQELRVRGELGLRCRAWHRVVHSAEQLAAAVREWRQQQPPPAGLQFLAQLQSFQRLVQQTVFKADHVAAAAGTFEL